jgi:dienelactone hydrolase
VEELQSKGKSSLGFAGFCWGGKLILETGLKIPMPDPEFPWEPASVFK